MDKINVMPVRVKIASIVRKSILSGEFAAGEELSLTDIATKLGVSRTPVREAFQTLANEGLIELRMNRGAVVKPIDTEFISDHFGMRILLEGEAVARAISNGMAPEPLIQLQKDIRSQPNLEAGTVYVDYNQDFHTRIWDGAKSKKVYDFCETLWNGPSFSKAVSDEEHRRRSIEEHEEIVRCILQNQPEEGRRAMAEHLKRSCNNILAALCL